ncbi:NUDIX hydrolase [archaeon]|nr:NUDIX hydrolase [archaeon]
MLSFNMGKYIYQGERILLSGCFVLNDKREILLLYRKKHGHYETPGGKVHLEECSNPDNLTIEDLAKTAERETYEELGDKLKIGELTYFGKAEFKIPDGRLAIAHKFVTSIIRGSPKLTEPELFSRMDWLPIDRLGDYAISPDLKLLLPEIKRKLIL